MAIAPHSGFSASTSPRWVLDDAAIVQSAIDSNLSRKEGLGRRTSFDSHPRRAATLSPDTLFYALLVQSSVSSAKGPGSGVFVPGSGWIPTSRHPTPYATRSERRPSWRSPPMLYAWLLPAVVVSADRLTFLLAL